ncbi:RL36 [Hepatospora eriocheir]|uniref:RL36 n=1 Tax=Hepatospora eriocheir TaxID=1081669 RepID=A0A1X0QBN0_9MICR|nr:RL36 [Hepatospora eriocheir]ORD98849.1 RL36 [Hepatospora eriocheir]
MRKFFRDRHVKHPVTKINLEAVVNKKHKSSATKKLCKDIAFEVCGFNPLERKVMEYIKSDNSKKGLNLLKKRYGSLKAANKKFELLNKKMR